MGCPKRGTGVGHLYKSALDRNDSADYDEDQNPIVNPLSNAELACMPLVKNTFGIKLEAKTKDIWKHDSAQLFIGGSITVCTALALAVAAIVVAARTKHSITK